MESTGSRQAHAVHDQHSPTSPALIFCGRAGGVAQAQQYDADLERRVGGLNNDRHPGHSPRAGPSDGGDLLIPDPGLRDLAWSWPTGLPNHCRIRWTSMPHLVRESTCIWDIRVENPRKCLDGLPQVASAGELPPIPLLEPATFARLLELRSLTRLSVNVSISALPSLPHSSVAGRRARPAVRQLQHLRSLQATIHPTCWWRPVAVPRLAEVVCVPAADMLQLQAPLILGCKDFLTITTWRVAVTLADRGVTWAWGLVVAFCLLVQRGVTVGARRWVPYPVQPRLYGCTQTPRSADDTSSKKKSAEGSKKVLPGGEPSSVAVAKSAGKIARDHPRVNVYYPLMMGMPGCGTRYQAVKNDGNNGKPELHEVS
ncbi:hypothetical protein PAPYR_8246 [Paratrimastix pyriformis]|uniref:Uncharacterized protein n=1 Tax=Paratrimastix pyriformis TaxID=342808 RepID=A0ABQ8UB25_9EUKA|nr:hypothetical protein PAPYR_8246 [Paratrimastix pyriformis]